MITQFKSFREILHKIFYGLIFPEKGYANFKQSYLRHYCFTISTILFMGSFLWAIRDFYTNTFVFNPFYAFCKLVVPIIYFIDSIFIYATKKSHLWAHTLSMLNGFIFFTFFLYKYSYNGAQAIDGDIWIVYYVIYYTISLAATNQFFIFSSVVIYTICILNTDVAINPNGFISYVSGWGSDRVIFTGLVTIYIPLWFLSVMIRKTLYRIYLFDNKIKQISVTDALTNCYNRHFFEDHSIKSPCTVMICDIDYFKDINDSYGHEAGDSALITVANAIRSCSRKDEDYVIRLGGDEFLVIFNGIIDAEERYKLILNHLSSNGNLHNITLSIGSYIYDKNVFNLNEVLHNSDIALYRSKELGRNRLTRYEDLQVTLCSAKD